MKAWDTRPDGNSNFVDVCRMTASAKKEPNNSTHPLETQSSSNLHRLPQLGFLVSHFSNRDTWLWNQEGSRPMQNCIMMHRSCHFHLKIQTSNSPRKIWTLLLSLSNLITSLLVGFYRQKDVEFDPAPKIPLGKQIPQPESFTPLRSALCQRSRRLAPVSRVLCAFFFK